MQRLVCLLRAINVGGRNKIPMADLRAALGDVAEFDDVATYIQSGNVAFDSGLEPDAAAALVAKTIEASFGLTIGVMVRTVAEVQAVIAGDPFDAAPMTDDGKAALYVAFCKDEPDVDKVEAMDRAKYGSDVFEVLGRHIYVRYSDGAASTKLTHAELEKRLRVESTMRNWKTTNKLVEF